MRCARCDRAFWLAGPEAPAPEHSRWDRRVAAHHESTSRCDGSGQPGYWIGEGETPRGWPSANPTL